MIARLYLLNLKALGLRYFRIGTGRAGAHKVLPAALVILGVAAALAFSFAAVFKTLLAVFLSAGLGWMYFAYLALAVFGLCVVGTIFAAQAQLFDAKDNELLLAMPLRPAAILVSRLLVMFTFEYGFTAVIALPAAFVWLESGQATAAVTWRLALLTPLLPLMATSLSLLLAWLLSLAASRMTHHRIVTLVLSLGFFTAYLYVSLNLQNHLNELMSRGVALAEAFRTALPPFYAFGAGVAAGGTGDMLRFLLWALLPFLAALALLAGNYKKMLTANRGGVKTVYKEKAAKAGSPLRALMRKELAHYLSRPSVVLNSSMGSVLMLLLTVLLPVKKVDILAYAALLTQGLGSLSLTLPALAAVSLMFLAVTNTLSASLISLEGKQLWIVQSLPLAPQTVLRSKIAVHLLISGLPCLAASACAAAVLAGPAGDRLLLLLLPALTCLLTALAGTAVNLCFPKLAWLNETYVVKQGLSAIIMLMGPAAVLAGLGTLYLFVLAELVSATAFLWLCAALFAAASGLVYAWLMKSGARRFAALAA